MQTELKTIIDEQIEYLNKLGGNETIVGLDYNYQGEDFEIRFVIERKSEVQQNEENTDFIRQRI